MSKLLQNQSKIYLNPYFFIEFTKISEDASKNCEKCRMGGRNLWNFPFSLNFSGGKCGIFPLPFGGFGKKQGIILDGGKDFGYNELCPGKCRANFPESGGCL
jgi:hypothetical protein